MCDTSPLYLCEGDFFQMGNVLSQMVPLRVIGDLSTPTKTLIMLRTRISSNNAFKRSTDYEVICLS